MRDKQLTLASLFDGSGGFPLAATLCGIKPILASEVEPFPIRVTTKRFVLAGIVEESCEKQRTE